MLQAAAKTFGPFASGHAAGMMMARGLSTSAPDVADVVIVGGGMVGAALAALLGKGRSMCW